MSDSDALAFRARLGEYLEGFMGDLESEASRRHFCELGIPLTPVA